MTTRALLRGIGELVRSLRVARGLTQRAVGERAGIVDKYVSEIERGTRDVPLSTLLAVVERGLSSRLVIHVEDDRDGGAVLRPRTERLARAIDRLPEAKRAQVAELVEKILEVVA
jgi:transcriptional regulator with XRE-family HTH domain